MVPGAVAQVNNQYLLNIIPIASGAKQSQSGLPRRGLLAMTRTALRQGPMRRHPQVTRSIGEGMA